MATINFRYVEIGAVASLDFKSKLHVRYKFNLALRGDYLRVATIQAEVINR